MLCIGDKEKKKDIKKESSFPFLISFFFSGRPAVAYGNAQSLAAQNNIPPYPKFSGKGCGGNLSAKERFPPNKSSDVIHF